MKSSTVMRHPELYKETMNLRRQDFTASLSRFASVPIVDALTHLGKLCTHILIITKKM